MTSHPEIFYRIVARVAVNINKRLRVLSDQIFEGDEAPQVVSGFRIEHDSLGQREIPLGAYYGVQTQRAMENFPISGIFISNFEHMIEAFALVKKAAALANGELKALDEGKMKAICAACDELLAGKLREHFTVDMFQGGAGTSTNMNANEVIANRGLELMGFNKGEYEHLHPNDHVNRAQSTNDTYPTSIKLAVLLSARDLTHAMQELCQALEQKAEEFKDVLKMGRTENQDAVPMTLGQEFSAYAVMIGSAIAAIEKAEDEFLNINMGATAIGTGINSPPGYATLVTKKLAEVSGFPFRRAGNLVEATQNAGTFVQMSATLKLDLDRLLSRGDEGAHRDGNRAALLGRLQSLHRRGARGLSGRANLAEEGYFSNHLIWLELGAMEPIVVVGAAGSIRFDLKAVGKSCHSG